MRSKRVKNTGTSASLFESLYGSRLAATSSNVNPRPAFLILVLLPPVRGELRETPSPRQPNTTNMPDSRALTWLGVRNRMAGDRVTQ